MPAAVERRAVRSAFVDTLAARQRVFLRAAPWPDPPDVARRVAGLLGSLGLLRAAPANEFDRNRFSVTSESLRARADQTARMLGHDPEAGRAWENAYLATIYAALPKPVLALPPQKHPVFKKFAVVSASGDEEDDDLEPLDDTRERLTSSTSSAAGETYMSFATAKKVEAKGVTPASVRTIDPALARDVRERSQNAIARALFGT